MKKILLWTLLAWLIPQALNAQTLSQTPNLGLYIIPFDYPRYDVPINENTNILDTKVTTLNLNCSDGQVPQWASGKFSVCGTAAAGSGHTIYDEGTPLSGRSKLRFLGAQVSVTDNAGNDSSDVTIIPPTAATITFSPTGTVASTTVQGAIAEVALEAQPVSANLTNFAGLACTGGLYRIGANSHECRTPTGQTGVLNITNADGIAGAPAYALATNFINGVSHFAADAGSSDTYAACPQSISLMPTPALIDGSWFILRVNTANTDAATLNACSLGAQDLVKLVGGVAVPLATGDLDPNYPVLVSYRSATADWIILSTLKSAGTGGGAGTPGGSTTQVQFNSAGAFAGDVDFTFDTATNRLATGGGYTAGDCTTNCTSQALTATGLRTATWAVSADYDIAGTTGTKTSGDATKFDASGRIVRGGTANRVFQFLIGAKNGVVLVDGDDEDTIFYNDFGQGITINKVWCESDAGTPSINLQRDDGSPANILSSNLTCTTTGAETTAFSGGENLIASTNRVDFVMVAAGGVAKRVTVSVRYTLD